MLSKAYGSRPREPSQEHAFYGSDDAPLQEGLDASSLCCTCLGFWDAFVTKALKAFLRVESPKRKASQMLHDGSLKDSHLFLLSCEVHRSPIICHLNPMGLIFRWEKDPRMGELRPLDIPSLVPSSALRPLPLGRALLFCSFLLSLATPLRLGLLRCFGLCLCFGFRILLGDSLFGGGCNLGNALCQRDVIFL